MSLLFMFLYYMGYMINVKARWSSGNASIGKLKYGGFKSNKDILAPHAHL